MPHAENHRQNTKKLIPNIIREDENPTQKSSLKKRKKTVGFSVVKKQGETGSFIDI